MRNIISPFTTTHVIVLTAQNSNTIDFNAITKTNIWIFRIVEICVFKYCITISDYIRYGRNSYYRLGYCARINIRKEVQLYNKLIIELAVVVLIVVAVAVITEIVLIIVLTVVILINVIITAINNNNNNDNIH